MTTLCILTPDPGYHEYWRPVADQYRALFGDALSFRQWNAAGDLSGFAIVLPLLAWGYQRDPVRWFSSLDAWEASSLVFANEIKTLRWNTNKDYLLDLEAQGVAIVPTRLAVCLTSDELAAARDAFGGGDVVIKPSISGGADGTYRLGPADPIPFDVIEREMLIQPMMAAVASEGEYSLFYFAGVLSHAILKVPATGDFRVQEQHGGREHSVIAPPAAIALAKATLAALRVMPLYARVDMVRGADGGFCLMELELIEPSLFLDFAADRGAALVTAVNQMAASGRSA